MEPEPYRVIREGSVSEEAKNNEELTKVVSGLEAVHLNKFKELFGSAIGEI